MIEVLSIEKTGRTLKAKISINGKEVIVTLYSDNSMSANPEWMLYKAGGNRSDSKLAIRNAIRNANK